jgi:hypothetical protein
MIAFYDFLAAHEGARREAGIAGAFRELAAV